MAVDIIARGIAANKADLDENGKVPVEQLPSYVDDVIEVVNKAALPTTGTKGKIYVITTGTGVYGDTKGSCYRWSGSSYVLITDPQFIEELKKKQDKVEWISLTFYTDGDTGRLTDNQIKVLKASELNYIWLNDMHSLRFVYRDDANNKAVYATNDFSSDGEKAHSVEINLSTKEFKVYHRQIQEKLRAGKNIKINGTTINTIVDLDTLSTKEELAKEKIARESGDNTLRTAIQHETIRAKNAESGLEEKKQNKLLAGANVELIESGDRTIINAKGGSGEVKIDNKSLRKDDDGTMRTSIGGSYEEIEKTSIVTATGVPDATYNEIPFSTFEATEISTYEQLSLSYRINYNDGTHIESTINPTKIEWISAAGVWGAKLGIRTDFCSQEIYFGVFPSAEMGAEVIGFKVWNNPFRNDIQTVIINNLKLYKKEIETIKNAKVIPHDDTLDVDENGRLKVVKGGEVPTFANIQGEPRENAKLRTELEGLTDRIIKETQDRESGDNMLIDNMSAFSAVLHKEKVLRESGDTKLEQDINKLADEMVRKVALNGNVYTPVAGMVNLGEVALRFELLNEMYRALGAESGLLGALNIEKETREQIDQALSDYIATKQDILDEYLRSARVSGNVLTLRNKDGVAIDYAPTFPAVMKLKGTCLQEELPISGQIEGDTYLLTNIPPSIYTGQMAIWILESGESGIGNWGYTSASIQVDATITESGINPVEGRAIYRALIEKVDKAIYEAKIAKLESGKQNKLIAGPGIKLEESGDRTVISSTGSGTGNPDDETIEINEDRRLETTIGGIWKRYNKTPIFTGTKRGVILNAHEATFRGFENYLEEDAEIISGHLDIEIPGMGSFGFSLDEAIVEDLYFTPAGETEPRHMLGVNYGTIDEIGGIEICIGMYLNELGNVVFGVLLKQDMPTTDITITISDVVQANVYHKKIHSSRVLKYNKEEFDVDNLGRLKLIKDYVEAVHDTTDTDMVYTKAKDGTTTLKEFPDVATVEETETYLGGVVEYNIIGLINHGTITGDTRIAELSTAVVTIVPESGYELPEAERDIVVKNATLNSYDPTTGEIVISNPVTNVTIIATCPGGPTPTGYTITGIITNGLLAGDVSIEPGNMARVYIVPDSGPEGSYTYPEDVSDIEVTNATIDSYDNTTGEILISDPTDDVTVIATCPEEPPVPPHTGYAISKRPVNCAIDGPDNIEEGGTAEFTIIPDSGYELPEQRALDIVNAKIKNYTIDSTTGVGNLIIMNPSGDVTINCEATEKRTTYNLDARITNGSWDGPTVITTGELTRGLIIPDTGFILPDVESLMVENAYIYSYDQGSGELILHNPTSDVTITGACDPE